MTARGVFITVGLAAVLAGSALWFAMQPRRASQAQLGPVAISPAALMAASFTGEGRPQSLARFQGKVVVLNFWATWCAPCREEMPAFTRLQSRWGGRQVQFVGLSAEEPAKAEAFGRELGINYPLWTGGDAVGDLSRRLGNERGVLPHTAILGPQGQVLAQRVGPYTEAELEAELHAFASKS